MEMKKILFAILLTAFVSSGAMAQRSGGHSSSHSKSHRTKSSSKTKSSANKSSSSYSAAKPVYVHGYFRKDGTFVHSYYRALPGAAGTTRTYGTGGSRPIVSTPDTTNTNVHTVPLYIYKNRYYTKDGVYVADVQKENASVKDVQKADERTQKIPASIDDCKRKAKRKGGDPSKCESKYNISPSQLMSVTPVEVSVATVPEPDQPRPQ